MKHRALPYAYHEHKYLVRPHVLSLLSARLRCLALVPEDFPRGRVESVYYDTLTLRALQDCKSGTALKTKLRIRRYNTDPRGKWQIKSKNGAAVQGTSGTLSELGPDATSWGRERQESRARGGP